MPPALPAGEGSDDDPIVDDNFSGSTGRVGKPRELANPEAYTHPIAPGATISRRFAHYHTLRDPATGAIRIAWLSSEGKKLGSRRMQTDGWTGQIARTRDGGKSWTTVFTESASAEYYFNVSRCPHAPVGAAGADELLLPPCGVTARAGHRVLGRQRVLRRGRGRPGHLHLLH